MEHVSRENNAVALTPIVYRLGKAFQKQSVAKVYIVKLYARYLLCRGAIEYLGQDRLGIVSVPAAEFIENIVGPEYRAGNDSFLFLAVVETVTAVRLIGENTLDTGKRI